MKEIVNFLADNWSYISTAFIALLYIILIFIKKRPFTLDDFQRALDDTYRNLPFFIQKAEESVSSGASRKNIVLEACIDNVVTVLGRKLTDKEKQNVRTCCSIFIEEVLTCPTKKGGLGREEKNPF